MVYLRFVQMLLLFTFAYRGDMWCLYLCAVGCILPYFFHCDPTKYAGLDALYLEMFQFPVVVLQVELIGVSRILMLPEQ